VFVIDHPITPLRAILKPLEAKAHIVPEQTPKPPMRAVVVMPVGETVYETQIWISCYKLPFEVCDV
jgi:hypothetical protein